ncbi:MAG: epoxyqueuosine reductase QueH [Tissierellia bacterium]|nr:epoxyqueuosine reductase QueH [Tissierellia bacterium]
MINYQRELDKLLESLETKPKLLLHSCCGPCSSYVIDYLKKYFEITIFFYNPQIEPREEYLHRLETQRELALEYEIEVLEGHRDATPYYNGIKGMENQREGGERCGICYQFRMEETAKMAKENNFPYFATTLSVSPHKNALKINKIGEQLSLDYEINHLPSDFKKRGGYQKSVEISKELGLYRQDYCGCIFSKNQREQEKQTHEKGEEKNGSNGN